MWEDTQPASPPIFFFRIHTKNTAHTIGKREEKRNYLVSVYIEKKDRKETKIIMKCERNIVNLQMKKHCKDYKYRGATR